MKPHGNRYVNLTKGNKIMATKINRFADVDEADVKTVKPQSKKKPDNKAAKVQEEKAVVSSRTKLKPLSTDTAISKEPVKTRTPVKPEKPKQLVRKFANPDAVPDSEQDWTGHFLECSVEDLADDEGEITEDGEYYWEFDLFDEDKDMWPILKPYRTIRIEIDSDDKIVFTAA
jgi:hypothetical protein